MEQFRADLHIHSKYSRATSKSLTPRNLAAWAKVKGLSVVGTGDFQHPDGWKSFPNSWRKTTAPPFGAQVGKRSGTRNSLVRRVSSPPENTFHPSDGNQLHLQARRKSAQGPQPGLCAEPRRRPPFQRTPGSRGQHQVDGRPILGLDSRNLLEMVLELDPLAFLVPAHIWTPWFSLFGSKSGFDSIEECFGDLSQHIFALETGLSSDPDMNWHLSALDRFRLISNSDAHSGEKLGREANVFSGDMSYEGILRALRGEGLGRKFLGTVEFFPEEGKYHLDGHRKCGIVMEPEETRSRGGICPVCGKPITVGVLNRVMELADREKPEKPSNQPGFTSLIPLRELMGEILGCGPATKKVSTPVPPGHVPHGIGAEHSSGRSCRRNSQGIPAPGRSRPAHARGQGVQVARIRWPIRRHPRFFRRRTSRNGSGQISHPHAAKGRVRRPPPPQSGSSRTAVGHR